MAFTKHDDGCLKKVKDDEPIFVLRAQDALAPQLVRAWAQFVEMAETVLGVMPGREDENVAIRSRSRREKILEAYRIADAMQEWQRLNVSKIPD